MPDCLYLLDTFIHFFIADNCGTSLSQIKPSKLITDLLIQYEGVKTEFRTHINIMFNHKDSTHKKKVRQRSGFQTIITLIMHFS